MLILYLGRWPALDIAQKVVRNQLKEEKAQEKLVSSLLDEMEKQSN